MDHLASLDSVADAGRRCVEALRAVDPQARLEGPAGGHQVGEVADLLGDVVHVWTWLVRARPRPYTDGYVRPGPPKDHPDRVQRLSVWIDDAIELLRSTDPAEAVAPMGRCDTVGEVSALLSDELLLHAADFEWVAGLRVGAVEPPVAAGALGRALEDRLCQAGDGLRWSGAVLRLESTDVDATWAVEAANSPPGVRDWWDARTVADDVPPAATLRGPAESLLRWAWGRPSPQPGLTSDGDDRVLGKVQAGLTGTRFRVPGRSRWLRRLTAATQRH